MADGSCLDPATLGPSPPHRSTAGGAGDGAQRTHLCSGGHRTHPPCLHASSSDHPSVFCGVVEPRRDDVIFGAPARAWAHEWTVRRRLRMHGSRSLLRLSLSEWRRRPPRRLKMGLCVALEGQRGKMRGSEVEHTSNATRIAPEKVEVRASMLQRSSERMLDNSISFKTAKLL
jgi:hypothetical protein